LGLARVNIPATISKPAQVILVDLFTTFHRYLPKTSEHLQG
jgi:hypothetical protein